MIKICFLVLIGLVSTTIQAGEIACWGDDSFGETIPPTGNDFIAVSVGYKFSLALRESGTCVGWGYDGSGQASPPEGESFQELKFLST